MPSHGQYVDGLRPGPRVCLRRHICAVSVGELLVLGRAGGWRICATSPSSPGSRASGHEQWQSTALVARRCVANRRRFDTWTRSGLLAARGYGTSPRRPRRCRPPMGRRLRGVGHQLSRSPRARPETTNGSASHTTEEPGAAAGAPVPVAAHGSAISESGPEALSSPEVLAEAGDRHQRLR